MAAQRVFITGTGTGVGKTVLTVLLACHLRARGIGALALKPYVSGSLDDSRLLAEAGGGTLSLEEVSPVQCHQPLSPRAGLSCDDQESCFDKAVRCVERISPQAEVLLIEGIGGLEVPLAPNRSVSDLMACLGGDVVVAGRNRLGILSDAALVQLRLQQMTGRTAPVVLMEDARPDASAAGNPGLLTQRFPGAAVLLLPHLGEGTGGYPFLERAALRLRTRLEAIWEALEKKATPGVDIGIGARHRPPPSGGVPAPGAFPGEWG